MDIIQIKVTNIKPQNTGDWRPFILPLFLYVFHRNLRRNRAVTCKSLVTVEIKTKERDFVWPSGSTLMFLANEIPGLIPGYALGLLSSGEFCHYMYGLFLSFLYFLPCAVFGGGPCVLLITGDPIVAIFLYVVHRNLLHNRALAYKSLVTVEVKLKERDFVRLLYSVIMLLSNGQKVPNSVPGTAVKFFSNGELSHSLCRMDVSEFVFCFQRSSADHSLGEALQLCLGSLPYVVH